MLNTAVLQSARTAKGRKAGATDNWSTPPDLYEWICETFGVTIDPCVGNDSVNYALTDFIWGGNGGDGLKEAWTFADCTDPKQVAYVNPPYSQLLAWAKKAIDELTNGSLDEAIFLIPARTDTKAFRLLAEGAYKIWFFPRRLKFWADGKPSKDTAPFPSALIWLQRMPHDTPRVYFKDPRETDVHGE